uniref:Putative DNA repair protein RAD23 n=1 Tax=Stygiella incarcerata TaxID=1712417 RepID=A0A192ZI17_9EUKA|nr:putative DNA repair protein RAD23 [Stygiella incarcerata]
MDSEHATSSQSSIPSAKSEKKDTKDMKDKEEKKSDKKEGKGETSKSSDEEEDESEEESDYDLNVLKDQFNGYGNEIMFVSSATGEVVFEMDTWDDTSYLDSVFQDLMTHLPHIARIKSENNLLFLPLLSRSIEEEKEEIGACYIHAVFLDSLEPMEVGISFDPWCFVINLTNETQTLTTSRMHIARFGNVLRFEHLKDFRGDIPCALGPFVFKDQIIDRVKRGRLADSEPLKLGFLDIWTRFIDTIPFLRDEYSRNLMRHHELREKKRRAARRTTLRKQKTVEKKSPLQDKGKSEEEVKKKARMMMMKIGKKEVPFEQFHPTDSVSSTIRDRLPAKGKVTKWGKVFFLDLEDVSFASGISEKDSKLKFTTLLSKGDVALWYSRPAIVVAFGPSPMSIGDEIRLAEKCLLIGKLSSTKGFSRVKNGDIGHIRWVTSEEREKKRGAKRLDVQSAPKSKPGRSPRRVAAAVVSKQRSDALPRKKRKLSVEEQQVGSSYVGKEEKEKDDYDIDDDEEEEEEEGEEEDDIAEENDDMFELSDEDVQGHNSLDHAIDDDENDDDVDDRESSDDVKQGKKNPTSEPSMSLSSPTASEIENFREWKEAVCEIDEERGKEKEKEKVDRKKRKKRQGDEMELEEERTRNAKNGDGVNDHDNDVGGGGGGGGGAGGGGGRTRVQFTPEEAEALRRLMELGFEQDVAVQAFLACDRNEELAANFLFDHGLEMMEDSRSDPPPRPDGDDGDDDGGDDDGGDDDTPMEP